LKSSGVLAISLREDRLRSHGIGAFFMIQTWRPFPLKSKLSKWPIPLGIRRESWIFSTIAQVFPNNADIDLDNGQTLEVQYA